MAVQDFTLELMERLLADRALGLKEWATRSLVQVL